jgi:hypothetical protein
MTRRELPVIACSLDAAGRQQRADEWRALVAAATGVARTGDSLTAAFPGAREAELRALVAAESECCPFFEFAVTPGVGGAETTLTVRAPAEALPLLDALFAR